MNKIKQRFSKYGLAEWIVFILGAIVLSTQTIRYILNTLEGNALDAVVFGAAFICLFAPKVLVGIIKKKSE